MKKLILSVGLFITTLFYAQNTDMKTLIQKANQGNAEAQFSLGYAYAGGDNVEQSDTQAVYWYQKSAEQGDADVQYVLGLAYYDGEGVEQSHSKAVYWLQKACENGFEEACEFLNKIKK